MWKQMPDNDYFLSFEQSDNYEISITNFVCIWTASYSKKAFVTQLKNSNEGLTLENDKAYIDNGLHLLNDGLENLKHCKFEENGENLLMTMRTVIEYPFGFECELSKGSSEFFFNKVTLPLLKTVSDLKSSENDLIQILTKKEKEVKAYKRELENKEIIFRHEVTKAYIETEHRKSYQMYRKTFGSKNIPESLLSRSVKLPQLPEPNGAKQEPVTIKQESGCIKQEHNQQGSANIPQESNIIKEEVSNIKEEPCTPLSEDYVPPLNLQPLSHKQEVIKHEPNQTRTSDRRKRIKLNY